MAIIKTSNESAFVVSKMSSSDHWIGASDIAVEGISNFLKGLIKNNNTIYLQLAEGIAKANKGQLYTTLFIFSKITKMNSIKRELDTDAAITFKSLPTFDFHFEFIISFCSFIKESINSLICEYLDDHE